MLVKDLSINVISRRMGVLKAKASGEMDMAQVKSLN
jgi:hypothetical protein